MAHTGGVGSRGKCRGSGGWVHVAFAVAVVGGILTGTAHDDPPDAVQPATGRHSLCVPTLVTGAERQKLAADGWSVAGSSVLPPGCSR